MGEDNQLNGLQKQWTRHSWNVFPSYIGEDAGPWGRWGRRLGFKATSMLNNFWQVLSPPRASIFSFEQPGVEN